MTSFKPTESRLFFSKNDPQDTRLGEKARSVTSINDDGLYLLGYPDDEGILLNGGRPGAGTAPDTIRSFFYKMTPPNSIPMPLICDLGNLEISKHSLSDRHNLIRSTIASLVAQNKKFISLGGGHDYGFPDAAGFLEVAIQKKQKPVVINFDAHFDVRPDDRGFHSGTPFYRLLKEFKNKFEFFEVGMQPQCNSHHHRQWVQEQGAHIIEIGHIRSTSLLQILGEKLNTLQGRPCFISLDIDVFAQSSAPGCSQSWESGLRWEEFIPCYQWLLTHLDIQGLGIYEVSPPLDQDHRTSKLAALAMYYYLFTKQDQG